MRRGAALVLLVVVAVALVGCSDGDDDAKGGAGPAATSTTTATPDEGGAPTTTAGDTTTTSDPEATATTSPNLPPSDSPLVELLTPASSFGAGYAPDDTYGDGTFDGDLCEDVTIDTTWDDQAGQALSAGGASITQAVLRFADAATATAFVQDLTDGVTTCDPNIVPEPVEGVGDEASRLTTSDEEGSRDQLIVRVGPLVTVVTALAPDGASPLGPDTAADLVAGLTA